MTLIFWGDDRFRSPIEPALVIFAAYGMAQIFKKIKFHGSKNKEPFLEPILRKLRIKKIIHHIPRDCILCDFGCGTKGLLLYTLKPYIRLGIGLDLKLETSGSNKIKLLQCNLDKDIPLKSDTVDVVTSLAVLEHLNNPINNLKEAYRILKKGGGLVLTTPAPISKNILEFFTFKLGILSKDTVGDHKNYFSKKLIRELLVRTGFEEKNIKIKSFQMGLNIFVIAKK